MPVLRTIAVWFGILFLMFLNGTLRVLVVQPRIGEEAARQIASIIGVAIVFAVSWLFVRTLAAPAPATLLAIGAVWLVLTLAFEFGFGRFVSGASWETLLADYNVLRGRLWVLVLLAAFSAPLICGAMLRDRS